MMQDNHIDYPFPSRPDEAGLVTVAPGIHWIRMPLPIAGLEHINLWLLDDGDGWTIIDTGMKNEQIRALWEAVFSRHLDGKPVTRVLCTHFHPDHMGLAGWLTERWPGAMLWCTMAEWAFGRMLWQDLKEPAPDSVRRFYHRLGWSTTRIDHYLDRRYGWYSRAVEPIPRSLRRLQHNESFAIGRHHWRVIVGRGHSPEHACLYCDDLNVLIGGDQVLPKISPHIGVYPGEPDANPLADYLISLENLRILPPDALVLPSHGEPFHGLHARLTALSEHHAVRLERLYDACSNATVAADLIPAMFSRQLREEDMSLATSEGLAHVHYLMAAGRMTRSLAADGIYRFQRNGRAAAA